MEWKGRERKTERKRKRKREKVRGFEFLNITRKRKRNWKVTFHRTHWIDFVDHDNVDVRQLQPDERSLHGLDNVFPR